MPPTSAAVASSPVAWHFAMLPAPTKVTAPGEVASSAGAGTRMASTGPRSSRHVTATRAAAAVRAARMAARGTVISGGSVRGTPWRSAPRRLGSTRRAPELRENWFPPRGLRTWTDESHGLLYRVAYSGAVDTPHPPGSLRDGPSSCLVR